jgi:LysM repeat protein
MNQMNFEYCDGITHTVKKGDTLYEISRKHNVPLALLLRANPYVDVFNLQVGDTVCIPTNPNKTKPYPSGTPNCCGEAGEEQSPTQPETGESTTAEWGKYVVKPGDTLADVLQQMDGDVEKFLKKNGLSSIYMLPGVAYYIYRKE